MTPAELRKIRRVLDWGLAKLAAKLGVHYTTIARWEMGETPVPRAVELALREVIRREGLEEKLNQGRS